MTKLDPEDSDAVAKAFGIADPMAREIVFENDERDDDVEWVEVVLCGPLRRHESEWHHRTKTRRAPVSDGPQRRWKRMRKWVEDHIRS